MPQNGTTPFLPRLGSGVRIASPAPEFLNKNKSLGLTPTLSLGAPPRNLPSAPAKIFPRPTNLGECWGRSPADTQHEFASRQRPTPTVPRLGSDSTLAATIAISPAIPGECRVVQPAPPFCLEGPPTNLPRQTRRVRVSGRTKTKGTIVPRRKADHPGRMLWCHGLASLGRTCAACG